MAKHSKKVILASVVVVLALVVLPISVKLVLENTLEKSRAAVDGGAAYSYRVPVASQEDQPFYEKYLPEIAAGVVFVWVGGILLFLGYKKKANEGT